MSEKDKIFFKHSFMKKIAILLLLSFSATHVTSQQKTFMEAEVKRLELSQQLSEASKNNLVQNQVKLLQQMGDLYFTYKPDSSKYWYLQSIAIARQNNLHKEEFTLLLNMINPKSKYYLRDSVQSFYSRGMALAADMPYTSTVQLLEYYGDAAEADGNYQISLEVYLKALDIAKKNDDEPLTAYALSEIANVYYNKKDLKNSLFYYAKSNALFLKHHDGQQLASNYTYIGREYSYMNLYDSSRYYENLAFETATKYYQGNIPPQLLDDIAVSFISLGEDSIALPLLRKCYAELINSGDPENYCETTIGLARIFDEQHITDSCIIYARKGLITAMSVNLLYNVPAAANLLAKYANITHHPDSAYYFLSLSVKAKDTLNSQYRMKEFQNIGFAQQLHEQELQQKLKEVTTENRNNLEKYSLLALLIIIIVVAILLWRNNVQKQKDKLTIEKSYAELKSAQALLIQSEKMASLGELTAGIAHEIQNPLNFVNNFSEVNSELIDELEQELKAGKIDEAIAISNDIKENEQKINHHGKRADAIVKGMLQHSRSSTGVKEPTDINALADEYLRLSYHGLRAKDNSFNATMKTDFDNSIGKINIVPQDIGRVLLNLYNNAFYAVGERKKAEGLGYEPTVTVSTKKSANQVFISVSDNGNGIPQKIVDKIFQPFFTTKSTGQGTGLGLSLAYDIVKAHSGELKVETKEGKYAEFIIRLPISI
jgi:two-component system NtrC family sensor kinase